MVKCPYCESTEFIVDKIETSNAEGNKETVSVLACKKCGKLLSAVGAGVTYGKPLPASAFIKR